jgi:UDP-N-acetylglucosamine 2-epimerase
MPNKVIFFFSDMFLPTFPYLEVPLYNEFKRRGHDVLYVLQNNDIRLTDPVLSKTFSSLNIKTIRSPKQIVQLVSTDDILVMRFAYKGLGGDVANAARKNKILMYDPSGIDIRVRACPAQYLTAKSDALKEQTLKKFPKQYKQIFVTGTIHCDAAATTTVDRTKFMESYGLNPDKKFVILTPANPGELGHQQGINNEYSDIINIVSNRCPDYEIAVKAHPLDYTASMKPQPGIIHKNEHYGGKHSWDVFAPGIKVIRAEEGYKAIKACDAILNVRSSIAMETAMFFKPLININRHKYTTNWPFDRNIMIDINIGELEYTLNTNNYRVDKESCIRYCEKENFSHDGKAYYRTVDVAEKILNGVYK